MLFRGRIRWRQCSTGRFLYGHSQDTPRFTPPLVPVDTLAIASLLYSSFGRCVHIQRVRASARPRESVHSLDLHMYKHGEVSHIALRLNENRIDFRWIVCLMGTTVVTGCRQCLAARTHGTLCNSHSVCQGGLGCVGACRSAVLGSA